MGRVKSVWLTFFWQRAKSTSNFDKSMLQLRDIHMGENSQPNPESDVIFKKVSVSVSKNFSLKKSISLKKIWSQKKSRYKSQKFGSQKSVGTGLKNLGLKKVSVLVSKKVSIMGSQKNLGISHIST